MYERLLIVKREQILIYELRFTMVIRVYIESKHMKLFICTRIMVIYHEIRWAVRASYDITL